jgi:rSAM/selenodomain-associated transferase 1
VSAGLPVTVIVIAKMPLPGQVKTRLTPPFSPQEAALLARAALIDTLEAVAATPVARRLLALSSPEPQSAPPWLPAGFEVIPQRGGGLDERLAGAFTDAYAGGMPMVLIGMDTPQVTPELLVDAATPLVSGEADAVLGPAADGGFWLLGLRAPNWSLLRGVPMSRADTGQEQLARLHAAGLRVALMPELTDVDYARDAMRVAASIPESRFATVLAQTGVAATTK